jgi:hypothetical protein
MTDEATPSGAGGAPPAGPDRPKGLPPKGPRPPRPGGARPPLPPPGPSAASLRLRAHLMLGILISCLVLGGLIAWKIWKITHPTERTAIDVDADFEKALDTAKGASKDIFAIQTKVWGKNEPLKPEDFTAIKAKLGELREAHDKMKDLLDILHAKGLDDTKSKHDIVPKWIQLKMWILDAQDLLDNQKPPEYGGLNIPMFVTSEKIRKAQAELGEINTTKDDIIKRNDPAEIKATRKKIADLRESFRGYSVKLQDLDKYVAEGLARPDLTNKEVMELDQLRDDANKAQMAVKAAGTILQAFPE